MEIFEQAVNQGLRPNKVAAKLSAYPDKEESEKYNKLNLIIIGVYVVINLVSLMSILELIKSNPSLGLTTLGITLGFLGVMFYFLVKKHYFIYFMIAFFAIRGMTNSLSTKDGLLIFITLIIGVLFVYLIMYTKMKLFPYQNLFNTKKTQEGIPIFSKEFAKQEL